MSRLRISRRTFSSLFGWVVCLLGLIAFLEIFRSLYRGRVHATERRKAKRLRRRHLGTIWASVSLIRNERNQVVHWPIPSLFKRNAHARRPHRQIRTFAPVDWENALALPPRTRPTQAPSVHFGRTAGVDRSSNLVGVTYLQTPQPRFNQKMEPLIRETLALSVLRVDEQRLHFDNIDQALQILQPLARTIVTSFLLGSRQAPIRERLFASPFQEARPESRRHARAPTYNWRIPVLYGKLVCLLYEQNPEVAFLRIRTDLVSDPKDASDVMADIIDRRPDRQRSPLDPYVSRKLFDDWHRRTVDGQIRQGKFRKQLLSRVQFAKNLVGRGASSNGQDNFGDGGSNPPAASHSYQHRTRPLRRRLKHRVRRALRRKRQWLDRHLHPVSRRARRSPTSTARRAKRSISPRERFLIEPDILFSIRFQSGRVAHTNLSSRDAGKVYHSYTMAETRSGGCRTLRF